MNIHQVVDALNERSDQFEFGQLQQIRKGRLGLNRTPCRLPFGTQCTFDHYAYHVGGRCELQFNVGEDKSGLRWGVAVSLQPNQSLPDVKVQFPKLEKLSEFIRVHGDEILSDFLMWHWSQTDEESSPDQPPDVVPRRLYAPGYFVFLGKHAPIDDFNPDLVLGDFDRLLPLYNYVEFSTSAFPVLDDTPGFVFTPGTPRSHNPDDYSTTAKGSSGRTEVSLRHRRIQDVLERALHAEPKTRVSRENSNGIGGRVDLIAERGSKLVFYEVKVGSSARACIREALGQLLEYGFWPGAAQPEELVVAGEPAPDQAASDFLEILRDRFRIPIRYRQVVVKH